MTRREWLTGTALVGPALIVAGVGGARVLAQTYVFTQEFSRRGVRLAHGVDELFETVREAGFTGVELMAQFFDPAARERTVASAKRNGIAVPITYCGGLMHTEEGGRRTIAAVLAVAGASESAGTVAINHNPDPIGRAKTDAELAVQAGNLNRLGRALRERGQSLLVHHHNPEMENGAREWRHILANTDAAAVSLCLDAHWIFRGGQDWLALVQDAGARTRSIHLRNSLGGVWSEDFGDGDLDYRRLAPLLRGMKIAPWLVVELAYEPKTQPQRTLQEDLRRSREYARRLFGTVTAK